MCQFYEGCKRFSTVLLGCMSIQTIWTCSMLLWSLSHCSVFQTNQMNSVICSILWHLMKWQLIISLLSFICIDNTQRVFFFKLNRLIQSNRCIFWLSSMTSTNIDDLPDEVLEFIFGHMPPYRDLESCALVCKRWTNIIRSKFLKKSVSILSHLKHCIFVRKKIGDSNVYFFVCRCSSTYVSEFQQRSHWVSFTLEVMG